VLADEPQDNPFARERIRTHQSRELWPSLLTLAILLFPVDVGLRRIELDRDEWRKFWGRVTRLVGWKPSPPLATATSLPALLARRDQARTEERATGTISHPVWSPELPRVAEPSGRAPESPGSTPRVGPRSTPGNTTDFLLEAKKKAKRRRN
jgi:hypothetical protein